MRPAALHRDARIGRREGGEQAGTTVDADHLEALADEAAADELAEKAFPFGRALALRQAEVDDLLPAVASQPEGDQHRPADGAGTSTACQHDAVEHQHAVLILERPRVKGGDHRIELLGHRAHRGGADRPSEDRSASSRKARRSR